MWLQVSFLGQFLFSGVRGHQARKQYQPEIVRRREAAKAIQVAYRKHRVRTSLKKRQLDMAKKEQDSAQFIQKSMWHLAHMKVSFYIWRNSSWLFTHFYALGSAVLKYVAVVCNAGVVAELVASFAWHPVTAAIVPVNTGWKTCSVLLSREMQAHQCIFYLCVLCCHWDGYAH